MDKHKLHKQIGIKIKECFGKDYEVLLDPACNGKHNLPLFYSIEKSRKTEFCNVDILIIKKKKIKVIFEIEESNVKPTQICGKFLASALAKYYDYGGDKYGMDKKTLFVQILDTSKLKNKSSKEGQWKNLEKAISEIIPVKGNKIQRYILKFGKPSDFNFEELIKDLKRFL